MSSGNVIGIHLCGRLLRRAELCCHGTQIEVATAERPWPPDETTPSVAALPAPTTNDAARCIAALPTSEVMTRCWTFPDAGESRIRQMVAHRLEADLPVPIAELTWGYRAGARGAVIDGQRVVLAQAARTVQVALAMVQLSAAGCVPDTLTTEAEALGALYRYGFARPAAPSLGAGMPDGPAALVLVTHDHWLVAVVDGEVVCSLRRIRVEPNRLEQMCRQCQQTIEAQVPGPPTDGARRALRRVLWCAPDDQAVAREVLARQLGVSVETAEAADRLVGIGGTRLGAAELATFGPAIGLALAGEFEPNRIIHLGHRTQTQVRPHGRLVQGIVAHPWRWTATAAGLLLLAAVIHVGALTAETHKMRALLDTLPPGGSPMAALQPKVRAMQRLETYRIDVEHIMAELCGPIPDSIVLSSVALARDRRLVIKGVSKDPRAVFALADALRKSARFAAVNPEGTEPAKGGGFTISAELVGVSPLPSSAGRGAAWR